MTVNGEHTIYQTGGDWGMVYHWYIHIIALPAKIVIKYMGSYNELYGDYTAITWGLHADRIL